MTLGDSQAPRLSQRAIPEFKGQKKEMTSTLLIEIDLILMKNVDKRPLERGEAGVNVGTSGR